jgi:membrane protease YdiL (CAAX protease family)
MTSKIETLKTLPQRLGVMRLGVAWRFLLSVAVMTGYMTASRIIYHPDVTTFANIELLRTPFRIVAAALFFLLMADVIFAAKSDVRALRMPSFVFAICISLLVPSLSLVENISGRDAFIVAVASIPVAFCEEFFFRGILQTLFVRHFGAVLGVGLATALFMLSHVGVGPKDATTYILIALAGLVLGLVYFRTRSMFAVLAIHATYDALTVLLDAPLLSRPWGVILLLFSIAFLLKWVATPSNEHSLLVSNPSHRI